MVLANPLLGAAIFTLLLAASLIASGVVMIVVSFSSKVQQGRGWILLSGLLTAVTGLMLASDGPLSGVWALGMILAIDLTFQGWALIAFGVRAQVRALGPDAAQRRRMRLRASR